MALKDFIEKITRIEKQLKLSELQVDDFNPWPYMRLRILNIYETKEARLEAAVVGNATNKKSSRIKIIISIGKSVLMYITNPVKKEKVDILYFTRQSESQDIICDELFNRYSGSFKYFFAEKYKVKVVEICDQKHINGTNKDVTYIDFLIKKIRVKSKFLTKMQSFNVPLFDGVSQVVKKEFGFHIDVESELRFIHHLSKEFVKMLRLYEPKLVFLTVFYRPEAMAMSLACHKLGIRVVEYQHGAQNDYHAMYTNWDNIPRKGYELIPDVFWMWGEVPKQRIQSWALKTVKHKAVVGGNLWMSYTRINREEASEIDGYYTKDKINILVTLQGDLYFPLFLLEVMQTSSDTIMWHFRDHPRLPISVELRAKIKRLPNSELEFSTQASLYELLKYTNIHITGYSTVAFEAQSYGVPTIFTHSNALNGYENLINNNGLFYVDDVDLVNALIKQLSSNSSQIEPSYIVSDVSVHNCALSLLME